MKVKHVVGTITLEDGSESEFSLSGHGWMQWGANGARMSETVAVVEGFMSGLVEAAEIVDPYNEEG